MTAPTAVGARNYLTLCQDLFREVGAAGVAPTTTVSATGEWSRLVNFVRDAEQEIQNLYVDWRWLRKVLAFYTVSQNQTLLWSAAGGTATGSNVFPSDLASWDYKTWMVLPPGNTQFSNLDCYEWEDVRADIFDTTDFAQPWRVIVMPDNSVRFDLIPDQSYQGQVEYRSVPYVFAADTDTSNIPARFGNQLILAWAQVKYGMFENAPEQVQNGNRIIYGHPGGQDAAIQTGTTGLLARLENDQLLSRKKSRFSQGNDIVIVSDGGYGGDGTDYGPGWGGQW